MIESAKLSSLCTWYIEPRTQTDNILLNMLVRVCSTFAWVCDESFVKFVTQREQCAVLGQRALCFATLIELLTHAHYLDVSKS